MNATLSISLIPPTIPGRWKPVREGSHAKEFSTKAGMKVKSNSIKF